MGQRRRRWAVVALAALLHATLTGSGDAQLLEFQWVISGSAVDSFHSTDPPFLGEKDLYVWLECSFFAVDRVRMDVTGSLVVDAFSPMPGVTNAGVLPSLDLSFSPCIAAPHPAMAVLVGTLTVRDSTGAGGCLCFGGANLTRECPSFGSMEYPSRYRGYSTDGAPPCYVGGCTVDYALPETWGRVKALYAR